MRNPFIVLAALLLSLPAWGTVTFANLTKSGTTVNATSFVTASVTPTGSAPVLLTTSGTTISGNGPGPVTSITSTGLTWVNVSAIDVSIGEGTGRSSRLEVWCGDGASPSASAITINWTNTVNQTSWTVSQSSGAAPTCAAAIGQIFSNPKFSPTASPLTVAMTSFNSANSATYGGGMVEGSRTVTAGSGMTLLGTSPQSNDTASDEFSSGNVTPVNLNYTSTNAAWGMIGVEIQGPSTTRHPISF